MKSGIFFERDGILNLVQVEKGSQVTPLTLDAFEVKGDLVENRKR